MPTSHHITSYGLYEEFINGKRVGELYLSPGWTSYYKRLQYQMYDVTHLLNGDKTLLGNAWQRMVYWYVSYSKKLEFVWEKHWIIAST